MQGSEARGAQHAGSWQGVSSEGAWRWVHGAPPPKARVTSDGRMSRAQAHFQQSGSSLDGVSHREGKWSKGLGREE